MFARFLTCALLAALALTGCSSNLRPSPQSAAGVNLAGTWTLDKFKSDRVEEELQMALRTADEKQAKKMRSRRMPSGPDFGGPGGPPDMDNGPGSGPPTEPWWLREQKRLEGELVGAIKPPESLRITQAQGRVELVSTAGGARRVFDPAQSSTLVTSYATLRIESGWEGNVFVIRSEDTTEKLAITERYSLTPDGELDEHLLIDMPYAKAQNFHVVYKRAG